MLWTEHAHASTYGGNGLMDAGSDHMAQLPKGQL